jgi:hypothetical protein
MNRGHTTGTENLIAASLAAAVYKLDTLPESADVWELRAKAFACEQVVIQWKLAAPSAPQVDAMADFVVALHGKILAAKKHLPSLQAREEAPLSRPGRARPGRAQLGR